MCAGAAAPLCWCVESLLGAVAAVAAVQGPWLALILPPVVTQKPQFICAGWLAR